MQIFIEKKAEELCPSKIAMQKGVHVRIPARRSPVGERFKKIANQIPASDQSASTIAEPAVAETEPTEEDLEQRFAAAIADMPK